MEKEGTSNGRGIARGHAGCQAEGAKRVDSALDQGPLSLAAGRGRRRRGEARVDVEGCNAGWPRWWRRMARQGEVSESESRARVSRAAEPSHQGVRDAKGFSRPEKVNSGGQPDVLELIPPRDRRIIYTDRYDDDDRCNDNNMIIVAELSVKSHISL